MRIRKLHIAMLAMVMAASAQLHAESTVYVFLPPMDTKAKVELTINGADAGDFITPVMQHVDSNEDQVAKLMKKNPKLQIPIIKEMNIMFPAIKKCVLKSEGPTLMLLNAESEHPATGQQIESKLETTLDVEDGEVYYLEVAMPDIATSDAMYKAKMSTKEAAKLAGEIKKNADVENGEIPTLQFMQMSKADGERKLKDKTFRRAADYVEE